MVNRLNTKEITRCTLRFYDSDFVKKLNDLYGKIGGTQQAFLGMLVNVGYQQVSSLYKERTVSNSVEGSKEDEFDKTLLELKNILLEKYDVEMKQIQNLSLDNVTQMKILSCLYNMILLTLIDDSGIRSIVDNGGLDKVPKRFTKEMVS